MSWDVVFDSSLRFSGVSVLKFDSACVPLGVENKSNSEQNYFLYSRFTDNMQTNVCLSLCVPDTMSKQTRET